MRLDLNKWYQEQGIKTKHSSDIISHKKLSYNSKTRHIYARLQMPLGSLLPIDNKPPYIMQTKFSIFWQKVSVETRHKEHWSWYLWVKSKNLQLSVHFQLQSNTYNLERRTKFTGQIQKDDIWLLNLLALEFTWTKSCAKKWWRAIALFASSFATLINENFHNPLWWNKILPGTLPTELNFQACDLGILCPLSLLWKDWLIASSKLNIAMTKVSITSDSGMVIQDEGPKLKFPRWRTS